MSLNKLMFQKLFRPSVISGIALLISIAVIVSVSWVLYNRTTDILTENLRDRLLSISITGAASINAGDLAALQTESDWQKPEWIKVVTRLKKIKDSNSDIVFMYIFRKMASNPTEMEFVADAESIYPYANSDDNPNNDVDSNGDGIVEPDGADYLQWPGQEYPEAIDIPETLEAYNGPLTAKELYEDVYGQVLTGYAPIKDESGNTVAILATDIKAENFLTITRQTLEPFLIFIALLTFIISGLIFAVIYFWRKHDQYLEKTNVVLNNLIKQRESLVYLVTHKVKGAFTRSKYVFAEMLDGTFGEINGSLQKMVKQALESDNAGIETVDLVLNAANLQKGTVKYEMKTFDLKDIVVKVIEDKKDMIMTRGLKLETNITNGISSYNVLGDAFWLKEVMSNLVENAVRYTKEGEIKIELKKRDDKILFSIKDTGIGIAEEDKKNLFTEGGRGKESVKINVDSTGYGLYSVKLIVDAHKGRVWMEDNKEDGHGSVFFVELNAG